MKRKIIVATAASLLLSAALLSGCGEETPDTSGTTQPAFAAQEQNKDSVSSQTEPGEVPATAPAQTTPGESMLIGPPETAPADPVAPGATQSSPGQEGPAQTAPALPPQTVPDQSGEITPAEPSQPGQVSPSVPPQSTPQEFPSDPVEPIPGEPGEIPPVEPQPPVDTPDLKDICTVETIYGELHFQALWSDYMQIEQKQEGDVVQVFFLARLNEQDYPLFDLTISPTASEGQLVLTDTLGAKHGVDVNMEASMEYENLDSNGQEILYSMQEQVNFIIENLS